MSKKKKQKQPPKNKNQVNNPNAGGGGGGGPNIGPAGGNPAGGFLSALGSFVGAIAMHHKSISEMQTGEGKTLTAVLPLYLNALTGKPVHLVTVNDYLAQRDCQWVGVILRKLGLTTAALISGMPPEERRAAYACDVVYGTASEFGFDYLRDNSTAIRPEELVQM